MRVFLAAFGDAGHAFPMLALGKQLVDRGHSVCFETWTQWETEVRAAGMEFAPAPEYPVFPTRDRPLKPHEATIKATYETRPVVAAFKPDVLVHDILTQAPALAAELLEIPVVTLVPHIYPNLLATHPLYSLGARAARTRMGETAWQLLHPLAQLGLRRGRDEFNQVRSQFGLPARNWVFNGISRRLTLLATLAELEYPRCWPDWVRTIGPLMWEPPGDPVSPPPDDRPVVLIAPSTSQDREHTLLRTALEGLKDAPVSVIATYNGNEQPENLPVLDNTTLLPWLSYGKIMPNCDLVICHGGHGTLMRALTSGCPVLISPAAGDMAENGARVQWAGLGKMILKRLLTPLTVRTVVATMLADRDLAIRVQRLAASMSTNGPLAARAVEEITH